VGQLGLADGDNRLGCGAHLLGTAGLHIGHRPRAAVRVDEPDHDPGIPCLAHYGLHAQPCEPQATDGRIHAASASTPDRTITEPGTNGLGHLQHLQHVACQSFKRVCRVILPAGPYSGDDPGRCRCQPVQPLEPGDVDSSEQFGLHLSSCAGDTGLKDPCRRLPDQLSHGALPLPPSGWVRRVDDVCLTLEVLLVGRDRHREGRRGQDARAMQADRR